jgi:hypothetical protein
MPVGLRLPLGCHDQNSASVPNLLETRAKPIGCGSHPAFKNVNVDIERDARIAWPRMAAVVATSTPNPSRCVAVECRRLPRGRLPPTN